jgi:hypothetical protein
MRLDDVVEVKPAAAVLSTFDGDGYAARRYLRSVGVIVRNAGPSGRDWHAPNLRIDRGFSTGDPFVRERRDEIATAPLSPNSASSRTSSGHTSDELLTMRS